jgi:hypothetical protein
MTEVTVIHKTGERISSSAPADGYPFDVTGNNTQYQSVFSFMDSAE